MLSKVNPTPAMRRSAAAIRRSFVSISAATPASKTTNSLSSSIRSASYNNKGWRNYSTGSNGRTLNGRLASAISMGLLLTAGVANQLANAAEHHHNHGKGAIDQATGLPIEEHPVIFPPSVPPPIERNHPALVKATITSVIKKIAISPKYDYEAWTFDGKIPGPFIRCRVGDTLELSHRNDDPTGMQHNIDFHAVSGPGGGAPLLNSDEGETRTARFKLVDPGLFVYHCAAAPIPMHIGNGMYGLILVEPENGVDGEKGKWLKSKKPIKEYAVMQGEFYVDASTAKDEKGAQFDYSSCLKEEPDLVLFNGKEGALTHGNVLQANVNEPVRIYFGNGGPNLTSTFHVIGAVFDKVYREGALVDVDRPDRGLQCVQVGPGSAAIVEFTPKVPGNYTLVDHALVRLDKGCVGYVSVKGDPQPEMYSATKPANPCPGCKVHP